MTVDTLSTLLTFQFLWIGLVMIIDDHLSSLVSGSFIGVGVSLIMLKVML